MKIRTVEDLIESLAGLNKSPSVDVEDVDKTIVYSIARQTFRGKALTDRQLNVMIEKLNYYKSKMDFVNDNDWANALSSLRMPLREIDRSKYIKIVDTIDVYGDNEVYESYKSNWQWVKIRFPFNKKTIVDLQDNLATKYNKVYFHKKGSHEHFFKLTENTVYDIVGLFKSKEFTIDQELIDGYDKIEKIICQPHNFLPGVYDQEIKNIPQSAVDYLHNDIGEVSDENIILYKDRSLMFGLEYFDPSTLKKSMNTVSNLAGKIASRTSANIFISSSTWNLNEVVCALNELKRFPILVLVSERESLDQISKFYNATKHIIPAEQQTVLFRLDNVNNSEFNQYIKEHKLNNSLANDIKVVYISENKKIPKPLTESSIVFNSSLNFSSFAFTKQHVQSDLMIQYDSVASPYAKYGLDRFRRTTEEI